MEKGLAVESASGLEGLFTKGFAHLYLGSETCEAKIPSVEEVKKAKYFCKKNAIGFSLVTPFSTDVGLERIKGLLPLLSKGDELICNDFGVLQICSKCNAEPVAGRLLNKQFRDPRIASFKGEMLEHLSLSQASLPEFREILSKFGVKRVELDNLLHGIGTNLSGTGFKASLHYPIVFISATRTCLSANAGRISESSRVGIFACGKDCEGFKFRLSNKAMPSKLIVIGNGLFFENKKLPEEKALFANGIDRLVVNSSLLQEA